MQAQHDRNSGAGANRTPGHVPQDGDGGLDGADDANARPLKRKRRDMKACASCRRSKVKCDGNRPCRRCANASVECIYPEVYKDPTTERLESLEQDVLSLKIKMENIPSPASVPTPVSWQDSWASAPSSVTTNPVDNPMALLSVHSRTSAQATTSAFSQSKNFLVGSSLYETQLGSTLVSGRSGSLEKKRWRAFQWPAKDLPNVVARGLVSEQQAQTWFQSFFSGSHMFVPIFCLKYDNYASVAARNAFLFDTIITVGCRAEEGPSSTSYQKLSSVLRERTANLVLNHTADFPEPLESVQALIVVASYSENGWLLASLALRLAMQLSLPSAMDNLVAIISSRNRRTSESSVDDEERRLFRAVRVWWGTFNLEHIFSLDGEKPPSVTFLDSASRMRTLIYHPERTIVDLRLISQVELNVIRARAHARLASCWTTNDLDTEEEISSTLRDASVDLDLWLDEWTAIIRNNDHAYPSQKDCSTAVLNLKIQHVWSLITLHLKAVSISGIENIAAMTDFQRDIVCAAKEAAIRHLDLLLAASSSPPTPRIPPPRDAERQVHERSAYLASFKWTMDFVWAKCAFSILLVLRLAMLLRDPPERLTKLLRDSYEVLEEIKNVPSGHIAYFHILQVSVDKCDQALQEWLLQQSANGISQERSAESEFEGYAPKEFLFEWNFPGLNIRHVPLGWQDLFVDFDFTL